VCTVALLACLVPDRGQAEQRFERPAPASQVDARKATADPRPGGELPAPAPLLHISTIELDLAKLPASAFGDDEGPR
jgi:hypothetical protein